MIAAHVIHKGVRQRADLLPVGTHCQVGRNRHRLLLPLNLLLQPHREYRQPLAEPDHALLGNLRLGEGGNNLPAPIQQRQRAGLRVNGEGPVLAVGKGAAVLHRDDQRAVHVHIAEAASPQNLAVSTIQALPGEGDGGHAVVEVPCGRVRGGQQLGPVRPVEAVQALLDHRVYAVLLAVGGYTVHPQVRQLLHRPVGGGHQSRAEHAAEDQGKQFLFHGYLPFRHSLIAKAFPPGFISRQF